MTWMYFIGLFSSVGGAGLPPHAPEGRCEGGGPGDGPGGQQQPFNIGQIPRPTGGQSRSDCVEFSLMLNGVSCGVGTRVAGKPGELDQGWDRVSGGEIEVPGGVFVQRDGSGR